MELIHPIMNRIKQFDAAPYPLDALRLDHDRLRAESDALTAAADYTPTLLLQTLRGICERLTVTLRAHIELEERLLGHPTLDHISDQKYLQVLTRHIASHGRPFLLNSRVQLLKQFLSGLGRHLDMQEAEMFCAAEAVWN
jgi:hypothetical protein